MKIFKILALTVAALSGSFLVNAQHVSDPSLVAEGAKLYSENCGRCHNPIPASAYSKKEWSVIIPHMREKAHMTGKESLAVEAFLASTLTSDVRNSSAAGDVDKPTRTAKQLFAQFGCQGCHQINGEGGNLGPTLDGVIENKGRPFVEKKMLNPKFNNASSAMPQFPMSNEELQVILDYLGNK